MFVVKMKSQWHRYWWPSYIHGTGEKSAGGKQTEIPGQVYSVRPAAAAGSTLCKFHLPAPALIPPNHPPVAPVPVSPTLLVAHTAKERVFRFLKKAACKSGDGEPQFWRETGAPAAAVQLLWRVTQRQLGPARQLSGPRLGS